VVGEQAGGGSNPPSQLPIARKENMEKKEGKIIAKVPMAKLPEDSEVGSRFTMGGYVEGMEGDMALVCLETFTPAEEPEETYTEEDARSAARQMDEQMGYME
jgi:hypothetical protein